MPHVLDFVQIVARHDAKTAAKEVVNEDAAKLVLQRVREPVLAHVLMAVAEIVQEVVSSNVLERV